jgi:hypothetical protein
MSRVFVLLVIPWTLALSAGVNVGREACKDNIPILRRTGCLKVD